MNPEEYGDKDNEVKGNKRRRHHNSIPAAIAAQEEDDENEEAKVSTGTGIREALLQK